VLDYDDKFDGRFCVRSVPAILGNRTGSVAEVQKAARKDHVPMREVIRAASDSG
jgi:hypothetical protein